MDLAGALPLDPAPARREALRGQRQRGSPLWTPFPACAAGGPARAAPEGLAPLDSLSRLRAGMGFLLVVSAAGIQPAMRAAGWIDFL